jgi:hypothetical protein
MDSGEGDGSCLVGCDCFFFLKAVGCDCWISLYRLHSKLDVIVFPQNTSTLRFPELVFLVMPYPHTSISVLTPMQLRIFFFFGLNEGRGDSTVCLHGVPIGSRGKIKKKKERRI